MIHKIYVCELIITETLFELEMRKNLVGVYVYYRGTAKQG